MFESVRKTRYACERDTDKDTAADDEGMRNVAYRMFESIKHLRERGLDRDRDKTRRKYRRSHVLEHKITEHPTKMLQDIAEEKYKM